MWATDWVLDLFIIFLIVLLLTVNGFDTDIWVMFGFWHKLYNITDLTLTLLYHYQTNGIEIEAYTAAVPGKCVFPKGRPVANGNISDESD